jgi:hypothetical protein
MGNFAEDNRIGSGNESIGLRDHRGGDIGMTEQVLHRANDVATLLQVRRERVSKRTGRRELLDICHQFCACECVNV